MNVEKTGHIKELDSLRGLLALWVLLYHVATISGVWDALPGRAKAFLDGANAVDVFIILSGFVITKLLIETHEATPIFIVRRFLRLYPAYIVCVGVAVLAQGTNLMQINYAIKDFPAHVVAHLTMLHGVIPDWLLSNSAGALLNPAWSVSLEWQFYLVAPLLIYGTTTMRRFIAMSLACLVIHRLIAPQMTGLFAFLPLKIHLFLVGITYAVVYRWAIANSYFEKSIAVWATLAPLLFSAVFLPYSPNTGLFIWLTIFAGLAARWAGVKSHVLNAAVTLISSTPAYRLGLWSYSIYLCHEIFVQATTIEVRQHFDLSGLWLAMSVCLVSLPLSLLAARFLFEYVERPFIRMGRNIGVATTYLPAK